MAIRYTISRCPKCNKRLDYSSNLDLIGNIIKAIKKNRALGLCPFCGEIYRTGFKLDDSISIDEKINYLESIKYENQKMKDLEFGFYGLNTFINFESEEWVHRLYKYLEENKQYSLLNSLIRKKIIVLGESILQIEDLKKEEAEIINSNKNELLNDIQNLGINGITEIKLIENYTSYDEISNIEEKINEGLRSFYKMLFKSGEEQAYGLVRTIRRIVSMNIDAIVLLNFYLYLAYVYYSNNKNLQKAANYIKEGFKDITQDSINEILALLLFNDHNCKRDVNTEKAKETIKNKYLKEVNKKI